MDASRLAAIRARVEAATEGPWEACTWDAMERPHVSTANQHNHGHDLPFTPSDAEFIAHAREDVPALLDEVERLTAALEATRPVHIDYIEAAQ